VNDFAGACVRYVMSTRIDLYTKSILTIIAVCLVAIAIRPLQNPPKVSAQQDALRVVVAGFDPQTLGSGLPVNIVGSGDNPAVPVMFSGGGQDGNVAVPVSVVNATVPVSVNGAGQDGNAPVAVNIVQVSSRSLGNTGVPVTANADIRKGTSLPAPPAGNK
jgi:hypothetical protein